MSKLWNNALRTRDAFDPVPVSERERVLDGDDDRFWAGFEVLIEFVR